eukprot:TRINITY_DN61460_c0_g1_i1.p1 TRINITY_DN61460_c0_g1~~TRINITY_DN61460_c0_g1_i1.p1  ORF type:complete len:361 (+),score=13.44 TRINITY_DN61460_c0_g1_i1:220-1302(+)
MPPPEPIGVVQVFEPETLLCPITQVMYRDPVFVPESGNTYERSALVRYWASSRHTRDPLSNFELEDVTVHPNWGKRREVEAYLQENPHYVPQGWPDRQVPRALESPGSRPTSRASARPRSRDSTRPASTEGSRPGSREGLRLGAREGSRPSSRERWGSSRNLTASAASTSPQPIAVPKPPTPQPPNLAPPSLAWPQNSVDAAVQTSRSCHHQIIARGYLGNVVFAVGFLVVFLQICYTVALAMKMPWRYNLMAVICILGFLMDLLLVIELCSGAKLRRSCCCRRILKTNPAYRNCTSLWIATVAAFTTLLMMLNALSGEMRVMFILIGRMVPENIIAALYCARDPQRGECCFLEGIETFD